MTQALSEADIKALSAFLERAGDLKDTLRSGRTNAGRQESTAEHSWRLALLVIVLEPYLVGHDIARMLKLAILHDLGEAITGDVPAIHQSEDPTARHAAEREAIRTLAALLPEQSRRILTDIAEDYEQVRSAEAAILKGLDKIETVHQHATGTNPADFDYAFNLGYARAATASPPWLARLRAHMDELTRRRMEGERQDT
jgi:putative hydrolase of HD superfamily